MQEVYEFLKECGPYYIATVDGDKPKIRPFGSLHIFEDKLYIQTGKSKDVSKQIALNPNIEICAMKDRKWIRLEAQAYEDERAEAQQSMLDANPRLKDRYKVGDGNTQVLYLKNATAMIVAFGEEPKIIKF